MFSVRLDFTPSIRCLGSMLSERKLRYFSLAGQTTQSCPLRPFFDKVTIDLPGVHKPLTIISDGASKNSYVQSLQVNGRSVANPIITHADIAKGGTLKFVMSSTPQAWGSPTMTLVPFVSAHSRKCTERNTSLDKHDKHPASTRRPQS